MSPSNSDEEIRHKTQAYLVAGAREVWIVSEDGSVRFYDAAGERALTSYSVELSPPAPGQNP